MLKLLDAAEVRAATSSSSLSAPSAGSSFSIPAATTASTPYQIPIINLVESSESEARSIIIGEGEEVGRASVEGPVVDESVDWAAVDEEVDAFLNETDDDDIMDDRDMTDGGGGASGNVSDSSAKSGSTRYVLLY